MPQVVNGCGTWYYGKKNVERHQGVCRACHRMATLESYDTRLYVVIVFIPIIPLAKKRIIEQCSVCRRHLAMPYSQWQSVQQRSDAALVAYRNSPRDAQLAEDALKASVMFRNLPTFLNLAPEI